MGKNAPAKRAPAFSQKKAAPKKKVVNKHLYKYRRDDRYHYDHLTSEEKEEVVRLEDAAALPEAKAPLRYRVLTRGFSPAVCRRMLGYVENLDSDDAKRREFLEVALSVPLGRYAAPFANAEPKAALDRLRESLDSAVYGHEDAKSELMRVVAKWLRDPKGKGLSILLCGDKGCGKTKFAEDGVAKALDMPYTFIGLGGAGDASRLLGFNYCYQGSGVGDIAQSLIRHQSMSQVMLFDEVDKACASDRGAAIINALIHLTDDTTNTHFHDRYLGDVDLDMSRSLMIFTCNDASLVSPILLDRMVRIDVKGYSNADKVAIASRHLIPSAVKEFGLAGTSASEIMSRECFVKSAVAATAGEQGVRDLKRALKAVCAEVNLRRTLDETYAATRAELDAILKKATASRDPPVLNMMYN